LQSIRNRKIAIIVQHLSKGGAESVAARLSVLLSDAGFDVTIILFQGLIDYKYKGKIINLDLDFNESSFIGKAISFVKRVNKIKNIKKQENFFATISFMENANFVNVLSKYKDKIIISTRNDINGILKEFERHKIFLMKNLYGKADKYVLISKETQADASKFLKIPENKTKVIYNLFDIEEIQQLSQEDLKEYKNIFNYPVLINAGRLSQQKGQWYLIRILKQLKEFNKDLKLVILGLGDAELKDYLVNLSKSIGLNTYYTWGDMNLSENYDVYFLGFQRNPYKFIANSKLFLFPSITEGFGNVLIESLACGLPVVSSNCKVGPREILAPDTDYNSRIDMPFFTKYGILMPVFDGKLKKKDDTLTKEEMIWCDVIKKVLNDPEFFKNKRNDLIQHANNFDKNKIINDWMEILEYEKK
jgi:glycosyltransferase involved in cell wall biosynthesis